MNNTVFFTSPCSRAFYRYFIKCKNMVYKPFTLQSGSTWFKRYLSTEEHICKYNTNGTGSDVKRNAYI